MEDIRKIEVFAEGKKVGTLAPYNRYQNAFEYSSDWIRDTVHERLEKYL